MYGVVACATVITPPVGENVVAFPVLAGNDAGLLYFVPKPLDHGYTDTKGVDVCDTAISALSGEIATPRPVPGGSVDGLLYFVPKPEPDHG